MRLKRWLGISALLWLATCSFLIVNGAYNAQQARNALEPLQGDEPLSIDPATSLASLRSGQDHLGEAVDSFDAGPLRPLRVLPILGRQLQSARAIAGTTLGVVDAVIPVLEEVEATRSNSGELDRIATLERMAVLFGAVERASSDIDLGPDQGLVRPLAEARTELAVQLVEINDLADEGAVAADGLSSFLADGKYLLLGGNNAEMRVGFGMFLSVGVLSAADGQLTLPGLTPAQDLVPVPFGQVTDRDVAERWGFLGPGDDYRKVAYSARFEEYVAPQVLAMWESQTGEVLDGVVYLDPFALEALIGVLGPVTVDETTLDGDSALEYMLKSQYEVFLGEENIEARQDVLSALAGQVATDFGNGEWDPVEVLRAMEAVVRDRHLMVYSTSPAEQDLWRRLNVSGSLSGWEVGGFLVNNGASKLDPFVSVSVDVEIEERELDRRMTLTIRAENNAAPSLNDYALGPWEALGLPEAGAYLGRFVAYAPAAASNIEVTSGQDLDVFGPDGQVWVVGTQPQQILPGQVEQMVIEFDLPYETEFIEIVPGARFPATEWRVDGEVLASDHLLVSLVE